MSDSTGIWDLCVIRREPDGAYLRYDGSYGALERAVIYISLVEGVDAELQATSGDKPVLLRATPHHEICSSLEGILSAVSSFTPMTVEEASRFARAFGFKVLTLDRAVKSSS